MSAIQSPAASKPNPDQQSEAPLRIPGAEEIASSVLAGFSAFASKRTGRIFTSYETLHAWSVEESARFWTVFREFSGVIGDWEGDAIGAIDHVPWARFFPDSLVSYAENILRHAHENPDAPAMIARCQDGADRVISWRALCEQVSLWEQALAGAGVTEGDRVAVYLPNVPEAMIILLAASNMGAIFSSAGMEMGPSDLISRFDQVRPKIVIAGNSYVHGAKSISREDVIEKLAQSVPGIERIVLFDAVPDGDDLKGDLYVSSMDFLGPYRPKSLVFKRHAFNHPLYILFSSGSTGKPKCFEHSTGGVLLKHLSEHMLNCEIRPGDRVFYHATPSWMMWNWLVGALACGAAILLYDGSPFYPDAYAQWNFTAAHRCTHHGSAAPVILGWAGAQVDMRGKDGMDDLRMVLSTGAILPPQGYGFIHQHIKADVKISSISGGTDIVGCFVGGNAYTPTYAGQTNGPMMGMDVRVWDDEGRECAAEQAGELVCLNPFPSMPLRFLNDDRGERYTEEYFSAWPGRKIWRHGDSIVKTAQGQIIIVGRSDATLNQNGVRIGTSAIYQQIEPFADEVADMAAADFKRPDNSQTITVLFLVLKSGADEIPQGLQDKIRKAVKDNITPYAIPSEMFAVPGILKTPNGKKAEVVIKKIVNGAAVPNPALYGEELVATYEKLAENLRQKYAG